MKKIVPIIFWLPLVCSTALATPQQVPLESSQSRHLTSELMVLADPAQDLTLEKVQELWLQKSSQFYPAPKSGFLDYSDGVYWSVLDLKNSSTQAQHWIMNFDDQYSNNIDVYRMEAVGAGQSLKLVNHTATGSWVPVRQRTPQSGTLLYEFTLKAQESALFFTRFKTIQRENIGVHLLSDVAHALESRRHNFIFQMYFGSLMGLFLFNFVIFLYTRSKIYFFYLVFEGAIGLMYFGATGHGDEFLPFPIQGWSSILPYLRVMTSLGALTFGFHFLRVLQYAPRLRWVYYEIGAALTLSGLCAMIGKFSWAAQLYDLHVIPTFLALMVACFWGLRSGLWEAKCYLVSWAPFFTGVVIWLLEGSGVLERSLFTVASIPFGNSLEMTLLALGLAHQIRELETKLRESAEIQSNILGQKLDGIQRTLLQSSKLAAVGDMASGMAHEINNPLSIIHMSVERAEHLIAEKSDVKELAEPLARIKKMSMRVATIISSLRDFAKDAGQVERKVIQVDEVILMTLDLCSEKFRSQGIKLDVPTEYPRIAIRGSKLLLSQVCLNLLTNAFEAVVKAVASGAIGVGHGAWVRLEIIRDGLQVRIRVLNAGPKITEAEALKVFIPFYTTKDIGQGLGLGLSQALGIAQSHGGDLQINLAESRTCFELKLPLV